MNNNKYISAKELLGEIVAHPLMKDITIERVVSYAVDFCRKWGSNILFEDKIAILQVDDFRATLPCDFYELLGIRDFITKVSYRVSENIFHKDPTDHSDLDISTIHLNDMSILEKKKTTEKLLFDELSKAPELRDELIIKSYKDAIEEYNSLLAKHLPGVSITDNNNNSVIKQPFDYTYKRNGNTLFLSTKNNVIEVAYQAIPSDEDGLPLIYDDATYIQALKDYIKLQHFTVLFDCGQLQSNVLVNAQSQYGFSARVLRNHFAMISPDEAQTLANIMGAMLTYRNHQSGFKTLGRETKYKIH